VSESGTQNNTILLLVFQLVISIFLPHYNIPAIKKTEEIAFKPFPEEDRWKFLGLIIDICALSYIMD
jgi:hypothetical protein